MSLKKPAVQTNFSLDTWLLISIFSLVGLGLVMITSASIPIAEQKGLPLFYFATHQLMGIAVGCLAAIIISFIPVKLWQSLGWPLLLLSTLLLTVLIIPGVSRPVNGSIRWFYLGPISIQPSEITKFALIIYFSGYIVRQKKAVENLLSGFLIPLGMLGFFSILLLLEPDFGAVVVIVTTTFGLLFLGGGQLKRFLALIPMVAFVLVTISFTSPYRIQRLIGFLDPWADQFDSGYQLTQSLIAFGRGELWGTGLGHSIQKLLYLPEPHTDFIFAVIAEELGLVGALLVLGLYAVFITRTFMIGQRAIRQQNLFSGLVAYGIGLWIGVQAFINLGVTLGLLPTKGLTLPLMSYGSSSMVMVLASLGLLFRIDFENRAKGTYATTKR